MKPALASLALAILLSTAACGSKQTAAPSSAKQEVPTFRYAPRIGSQFRHVMTRERGVAIVGTPLRQLEQWKITWWVTLSEENGATLMHADLKGLEFAVNGAQVLVGNEVLATNAFVEILIDSFGRVIDVRRTETLTEAIVSVARPEAAAAVRGSFDPQMLRYHFASLVEERTHDIVGRPAHDGATWEIEADPAYPGVTTRKLEVKGSEPCGPVTCLIVERRTHVAPQIVWEAARSEVSSYVQSQGGDPAQLELQGANVELSDVLFVEPDTLQFHGAVFSQNATITVATPSGPLTVLTELRRTSSYEF